MSYFTQRHANGFPLWSKVRKDPSSMGYRYLEAIGHETEIETINQIRLQSLNINGSILDLPLVYEIGGWPGLYEFENGLTAPEGMLPLFNYPQFDGDDIWPTKVEGKHSEEGGWVNIARAGESIDLKGIFAFLYTPPKKVPKKADERPFDLEMTPEECEEFIDTYKGLAGKGAWLIHHIAEVAPNPFNYFLNWGPPGVKFFNRKVCFLVTGSTHYKRYCMEGGPNWPSCGQQEEQDINFQGEHKIVVNGLIEGGGDNPFSETLTILDDGYYITKNKFKTIISVYKSGFNGNFLLVPETPNFRYGTTTGGGYNINPSSLPNERGFFGITSPYHLGIHSEATNTLLSEDEEEANNLLLSPFSPDDGIQTTPVPEAFYEAPLKLTIDIVEDEGTYLNSWFSLYLNGQDYRRTNVVIDNEEDVKELICSQWLIDENGEPMVTSNLIINPMDSKLYSFHIQDEPGSIGEEEMGPPHPYAKTLAINIFHLSPYKFIPWKFPRTRQIAIDIEPMSSRGSFGEDMPMWSFHKIMRSPVKLVAFKREKPSQINGEIGDECPASTFYGDWLQEDMTWSSEPYWFSGKQTDLPEDSWTDKKFSSGVLDELGQWNFYCETIVEKNTFKELEKLEIKSMNGEITPCEYSNIKQELLKDKNNDELFRSCTAISCEYLQAEKTIKMPLSSYVFSYQDENGSKKNYTFAPFQGRQEVAALWAAEAEDYFAGVNSNNSLFADDFYIKNVYWKADNVAMITFGMKISEAEAIAKYQAYYSMADGGFGGQDSFPEISADFSFFNQLSDRGYAIEFGNDLYLPDSTNNRMWFRENYHSVRITTNAENGDEVVTVYTPDSDEDVWSGQEISLLVQISNLQVQLQEQQGELFELQQELEQLQQELLQLEGELSNLQVALILASQNVDTAQAAIDEDLKPASINASLEEDVAQAAKELAEIAFSDAQNAVLEAFSVVGEAMETVDEAQEAVNNASDAINDNVASGIIISDDLEDLQAQLENEEDEAEGEIIQNLIDAKIVEQGENAALLPGLVAVLDAAEEVLQNAQTALEDAQAAHVVAEQVSDLAGQTFNNALATWGDAITEKQEAFNALVVNENNLANLKLLKEEAQNLVNEKQGAIQDLSDYIATLEELIEQLNESIENLETDIDNMENEVEEIE